MEILQLNKGIFHQLEARELYPSMSPTHFSYPTRGKINQIIAILLTFDYFLFLFFFKFLPSHQQIRSCRIRGSALLVDGSTAAAGERGAAVCSPTKVPMGKTGRLVPCYCAGPWHLAETLGPCMLEFPARTLQACPLAVFVPFQQSSLFVFFSLPHGLKNKLSND